MRGRRDLKSFLTYSSEKCFRAFAEVFAHNVGRRRITSLLFFTGWRRGPLCPPARLFRVVLAASFISVLLFERAIRGRAISPAFHNETGRQGNRRTKARVARAKNFTILNGFFARAFVGMKDLSLWPIFSHLWWKRTHKTAFELPC